MDAALKDLLDGISVDGRPILSAGNHDQCRCTVKFSVETAEQAYKLGREQTQSELALIMASDPLSTNQTKEAPCQPSRIKS